MPALLLANPYVDIILALALAWLSLKIVQALFGPLEGLPAVGGLIAKAEHAIAQSISNAMGRVASGASAAVGGSLHAIARVIEHSGNAFKRNALAILEAATFIGTIVTVVHGLKALIHQLTVGGHGSNARIKQLEREYHGIEHQIRTIERELRGIDETGIRNKLRSLDQQLQGIEDQTIPALRRAEGATAGELAGLEQWLGIDVNTNKLAWLAGLGTAALAALGLGGMGCDSNPFKNNKNACGLWGDLSSLLGVVAAILAVENFDALVHEMQQVEQGVISGMHDLFNLP